MEKAVFVTNSTTLKIPKGADKIRVQTVHKGEREVVEVVWKWGI